jgi:hypothetical protein
MPCIKCAIAEIEEISGHDIQQRNIGPLVSFARGNLAAAAASIVAHPQPNVAIITGFYLFQGDPPNCETDGPPGAAMMAAAFRSVGVGCRIVTDLLNAPVVRATLAGGGLKDVALDIVETAPMRTADAVPLEAVEAAWLGSTPPISHVIAIERCGPGHDGNARNALGQDMSHYQAPLEKLFVAGAWTTIGIGDLGNEVGMGSLPRDLVGATIRNGRQIWCSVASDHPIIAGVSNLAAAALLAIVTLLRPTWAPRIMDRLVPDFAYQLLMAAVRDGSAVSGTHDGRPPRPDLAVDGVPWDMLEPVYRRIHDICSAALQSSTYHPGSCRHC